MSAAALPKNEEERLTALKSYGVLDTESEEPFDRIARIAQKLFHSRIALVSLIDRDRQWFKSTAGLNVAETPRSSAFCAHAILEEDVLVVEDATQDAKFFDNPMVLGAPNIRFYAGAQLTTSDGHSLGTLCVIDDRPRTFLAEDKQMLGDLARLVTNEIELRSTAKRAAELEEMVNRDHLTDAFNRRAYDQLLASECKRSLRYHRPLCLAILDLDHFKAVNDKHGHAAGDAVLRSFADLCRNHIREHDLFARIGGEEFAICMPETDLASAEIFMHRLVKAAARDRVQWEDASVSYTISVGISELKPALSSEELEAQADKWLYKAKQWGRNRYVSDYDAGADDQDTFRLIPFSNDRVVVK